jgi:1,2-phenylacetyl-CoA epoxidase PaaB subunit
MDVKEWEEKVLINKLAFTSSRDSYTYQATVYQLWAVQECTIIHMFWAATSVVLQFSEYHALC